MNNSATTWLSLLLLINQLCGVPFVASAVVCTTTCADVATGNFDPSTAALCDKVEISVTCSNVAPSRDLFGGDVYSTDSDIQKAAYQSGLCADSTTVTL